MSAIPIRVRLTLAFAFVMAAVLAGMGFFVYVRVSNALVASVDQALTSQAREASSRVHEERNLVDEDITGGTTLAELASVDGTILRSTPPHLSLLVPRQELARIAAGSRLRGSVSLTAPTGDWRYLAVPAGGHIVVVARSLESREESLHRLLRALFFASPLALLLASLAGYGLAASALRPVEAMRRRAAAVSSTALGRLPVPRANDEISRLATTLNEMLERLEAAFAHERRFVSDASHELRTPLAMLRTELELALRRPRSHDELRDAIRSAEQETSRLSQLAEDLLLIARADQSALPIRPEHVAVDDLFSTVAERFARRAEAHGQGVRVHPTSVSVDADPARVEQALANLVANALAHGGGAIDLFAVERDDVLELHVTDAGHGFADGFIDRAFDRFSRADNARGSDGSGLGLSIVALIAQAHGGTAHAANRPEGGADVWLELPHSRSRAAIHALS
ncbi:MAG: HAMP domain-containing sensor histidine kinase [Gaiellaceae bacterium]